MRLTLQNDASAHALIAAAFLAAAILLGGGGNSSPGAETMVQLLCAGAALAWLWAPSPNDGIPRPTDRFAWVLCALVLALPLLQLIPLPPAIWTAAPGQESRVAALSLVGAADSWQPLSQSPPRTLASLLAMVPALFGFLATASLPARQRLLIVAAIAAMVLASALFGAAQVSLGSAAPYFYTDSHRPYLVGFQANRNAQADVLLIGALAAAFCLMPSLADRTPVDRGKRRRGLIASPRSAAILLSALLFLLVLAVILTGSRAGIALLAPTLLAIWFMLRPAMANFGLFRWAPAAIAALLLLAVGMLALQGSNTALGRVAQRFAFEGDFRTELWEDTRFAIEQTWPLGVGLGGFQPAMMAAERLEVVDQTRPVRAHNDYLELALEGGLPAIVLLCLIAALLGWRALRLWQRNPRERPTIVLSFTILFIVGAHSLVDYPLRSMALACLTGAGAGLLMAAPRLEGASPTMTARRKLIGDQA